MSRIFSLLILTLSPIAIFSRTPSAADDFRAPQTVSETAVAILRRNCWRCHGEKNQEGGIRLDIADGLKQTGDSGIPVAAVPENNQTHASATLLIERVSGDRNGEQMPPDAAPLEPSQIQVLQQWIELGLPWPNAVISPGATPETSDHWAYRPIVRPVPPETASPVASPVDAFIEFQRHRQGLEANPRANREKLLRRLSLVLTGVPPSIELQKTFLNDLSPDAYDSLLDRLLSSPQLGEKWATGWMDLARYADSNGFQADQIRDNWAYRDWLIDALNNDLPFDQFAVKQLAGDLLPNATIDDKVATGFHRMTPCNVEAGVHPEANRVNQVVDRVNTTATAFLGTTLECAQCHDHKYDPFTQRDYYQLFAYFNNTPLEVKQTAGVTWDFYGPVMEFPLTQSQLEAKSTLERRIAAARTQLEEQGSEGATETDARIKELEAELAAIKPVTTLVMEELPAPRETFVMKRGDYEQPAERVFPGTPQSLPAINSEGAMQSRLDLAQWIISNRNPLTARVVVNRWWAEIFGRGIVSTLEDFGTQSEPPTHPELLDWLASELIDSGWSRKHVLRLILSSETFCQDATFSETQTAADPDNRWLSRGPRYRIPAEAIRDSALAISGLLSSKMYGPPVMPYQPPDLWRSVGRNQPKWVAAENEDRFRRGIYIVFKRAAPYPSFMNFDTPDRGSCTVQRPVTNTPLQALNLLNDPVFAELSVGLAARIISRSDLTDSEKIEFAFRLALGRSPSHSETDIMITLLDAERMTLLSSPNLVSKRTSKAISVLRLPDLKPFDLATWTSVSSVLLNLDETLNY